ncbi:ABC transporter permease [Flavihumibacter cheonanensis]|uniref:ABC transporter permease n=1 Tax=Flavihumibacter cheonanensis TaxID=1442385 RepID=UPI001EF89592|nr:ABC transporter permease [Flavihumibacter cheonanensis]MCG7751149.1 ABC transporter permease [Flavihumibacter cheonanensis]
MLTNHWKIAYRSLVKNKFFTTLNIVGLAAGLTCFLLIMLYVTNELGYDRYHENSDRIYRINSDIVMGGTELNLAVASDPMGELLKKDYPEIEEYTRIYNSSGAKMIKKGSAYLNETKVAHVDSTYFDVFSAKAVAGDLKNALDEPNTVVLSRSMAEKYFGTTDVIGKNLETNENGSTLYKITGVMEDVPKQSHYRPDFLFAMENCGYQFGQILSHNFQTYLLLKKGTNPASLEAKFPGYIMRHVLPVAQQEMQIKSIEEFEQSGNKLQYSLTALTDIHLHSNRFPELAVNGNIQYVYVFSAVALFILVIACINFMNLATARSANRAREVGIRKVLGSGKGTLIKQFLTESTLLAYVSIGIALLSAVLLLPLFNELSGKQFILRDLFTPELISIYLLLPLLVGLLAGTYPAFFLSSFQPLQVLKSKFSTGSSKAGLRSTLVVVQFVTSIILIVGTIIIYRQLNYIQTRNLGFNKEQVLVINNTYTLGTKKEGFRNEIMKLSGVTGSTYSGFMPVAESARTDRTFSTQAAMTSSSSLNMQIWGIDENYIPLLGMEMKYGRNFSKEFGTDSAAIIINETTAALMGLNNPVGKKLFAGNNGGATEPYTIIGVVKNFHFQSMKQQIGPVAFWLKPADWSIAFKVNTSQIKPLISQIEGVWNKMAPGMPFEYSFLDESFSRMYDAEQRVGQLVLSFAILTILIACLGLFGLAAFMAEQRNKEIGVRKVLGASVQQIVSLLTRDFLKLVSIAALIAFPLAWYAMNKWLENFAFKTSLGWWVFLLAGCIAALIALLTVGGQAIKAAITNPIKSLRSE